MHSELRTPEAVTLTATAPPEPMTSPAALRALVPLSSSAAAAVRQARTAVRAVLDAADDRLLVIAGPCSLHDRDAVLEYAARLALAARRLSDDLLVVMRAYVEKPRSALGWPGLALAPELDGPPDPVRGFEAARAIMAQIVELGLPIGTEWLTVFSPDYLGDLLAWGSVGARSVENPPYRQLASALDMPIGMKNRTDGSVEVAVTAVRAAARPHTSLGLAPDGTVMVRRGLGNRDCHVVLRGGADGSNHGPRQVQEARRLLRAAGLPERLLIDASHGNSGKNHERQLAVAREIARRVAEGDQAVRGLLLESFLLPGRQDPDTARPLLPGKSVTDPCIGWAETDRLLTELGRAARARRSERRVRRRTGSDRRSRTDVVSTGSSPAGRAVGLATSGLFDDYVVYERDGVWTVAGGVLGSVALDERCVRTTWQGQEQASPWRSEPIAAIGAALAALPADEWNAYGWISFEAALAAAGRPLPAGQGDLAHLIVPRVEVRISAETATVACADDELRRAVRDALRAQPAVDDGPSVDVDLTANGEWYRDAVADAVREIRRGAFRKVVLSRRVPVPDAIDLPRTFLRGRAANTPARSFLLNSGGIAAAGFCPETVLEAHADGSLSTQPLAGTRALGPDAAENRRLREELLGDPKELVEHILSVRLATEELAGVCAPDSVTVNELLSVKERGSVQHLASRVTGRLRAGRSEWDALGALFPAVTASGIPKGPSCDFIARTEPDPRGLYSGAVLAASSDGSLDAGLVLRTVFAEQGRQWLRAGAGIIAESRPEREYEETCEKLRSIAPHLRRARDQGQGSRAR